jgi:hypothetical protein
VPKGAILHPGEYRLEEPPPNAKAVAKILAEAETITHGFILTRVEDGRIQTIQKCEFEERPQQIG